MTALPWWQRLSRWLLLGFMSSLVVILASLTTDSLLVSQPILVASTLSNTVNVQKLAQQITVRILTPTASGSGVIVQRQGKTYTVLTNWHVVGFSDSYTIITCDGKQHQPRTQSQVSSEKSHFVAQKLGKNDLAITQFDSSIDYKVAQINTEPLTVGTPVFAVGFPMYRQGSLETTFNLGIKDFLFTQGEVSLLPPKSLPQGYRLGYTNDIQVGMSGGPILDAHGVLVGVNGRIKHRDPGFGVYEFEDGTEPSPEMLKQMLRSSWGIPISTYLQFASLPRRSSS